MFYGTVTWGPPFKVMFCLVAATLAMILDGLRQAYAPYLLTRADVVSLSYAICYITLFALLYM
jgi:hypothetical protein